MEYSEVFVHHLRVEELRTFDCLLLWQRFGEVNHLSLSLARVQTLVMTFQTLSGSIHSSVFLFLLGQIALPPILLEINWGVACNLGKSVKDLVLPYHIGLSSNVLQKRIRNNSVLSKFG